MMEFLLPIVDRMWDVLWIIILSASTFSFIILKRYSSKYNDKNKDKISKSTEPSKDKEDNHHKLFFTSIAGAVGLGNIFVVIDAVQSAGPGTIFWLWIGAALGRYLKFWEIFLSLRYKEKIDGHSFTGGIIYSSKSMNNIVGKILGIIFTLFLLLYCIEVYQFGSLVTITAGTFMHYIPQNFIALNGIKFIFALVFLGMLFLWKDREKFLSSATILMKIFLIGYFVLFFYMLITNIRFVPMIAKEIVYSVVDLSSGIQSKIKMIVAGISTSIYSGDIAIGYEGVMQKYAKVDHKNHGDIIEYGKKIIATNIVDVTVCTASALIAILYCKGNNLAYNAYSSITIINNIFSKIPLGQLLFSILVFCAAFSTIATYLQAGRITFDYVKRKLQIQISENWFNIIAFPMFVTAVYYPLQSLKTIMLFSAGILVLINCFAIAKLITSKKINQ